MTTRTLVGTLVAWGVLLHASSATADTLIASLGEPIEEVSHAVRADVEGGIATFRVRRTIANRGERHEEAVLTIRLPAQAAATGLRIRVGETWYDGELMERERAAELYRELTGLGPHLPRDPALLSWLWADRLELRVFPVPPHATATVEYTLTVPTEYRAGVTLLSYPVRDAGDRDLADPVLTVAAQAGAGTLRVDGRLAVHEQPIVLRPHARDPRCGQLGLADNCVVSAVEAPALLSVKTKVEALVRHTYASDLHVVLATPDGAITHLWSNEGGAENDVRIEHTVDAWNMPAGQWLLGVADEAELDVGVLAEWSIDSATHGLLRAEDLPLHVPDAGRVGGVATIDLPTPIDAVATRFAHVEQRGAHVSRLEVDMPTHLSKLPTAPHVIFVIDASYSAGAEALDEQRRLIEGFLAHTPDARVEVVATRRKPTALFDDFIDAESFATRWEELATSGDLDLGNGSNLDLAVARAAELMHALEGRRYVVAFSDDRLRPSWGRAPHFAAAADLTAHVVLLEGDATKAALVRDDAHRLAPMALQHGGILVHAGTTSSLDGKQFSRELLHLVRPVRLEGVSFDGFDDVPTVLWEGESYRGMLPQKVQNARLHGQLWSRAVMYRSSRSRAFDRATAAWTFSHDLYDEFTVEQQFALAMFGRAVSPVTSYLAIEPGVRPSLAGIDRGIGTGHGFGSRGHGAIGGRVMKPPPSLAGLLAGDAARCRRQHPGAAVTLAVDTTLDEVVDVASRSPASPLADCLVEAAWALRLPSEFRGDRAESVVFEL